MENNSGKALKTIAVILGILGVIGAIVLGAMVGNNTRIGGIGFGVFVGTAISSFISALVLYGFGALINNTANIAYSNNEMNNRIKRLEKKLEDVLAEQEEKQAMPAEAKPVKTPVAPKETAVVPQVVVETEQTTETKPDDQKKQDGRIYVVDRSKLHIACPACGRLQKNDRTSCHNCGALFRD